MSGIGSGVKQQNGWDRCEAVQQVVAGFGMAASKTGSAESGHCIGLNTANHTALSDPSGPAGVYHVRAAQACAFLKGGRKTHSLNDGGAAFSFGTAFTQLLFLAPS